MGTRAKRRPVKALAIVTSVLLLAAGMGCEDAEEFRAATSDALQSGLTTIATGLLDGVFAVWEPDSTDDTSDTTS